VEEEEETGVFVEKLLNTFLTTATDKVANVRLIVGRTFATKRVSNTLLERPKIVAVLQKLSTDRDRDVSYYAKLALEKLKTKQSIV
jgi:ribosomal protein L30E